MNGSGGLVGSTGTEEAVKQAEESAHTAMPYQG
jgi:hypothetical protein